jgi:hypothetical protein
MSARNRRLPRHLSWPLTTSGINDALGPHMTQIGNLGFRDNPSNDGTLLLVGWVPPVTSSYGIGTGMPAYMQGLQIRVFPLGTADRAAARTTLRQDALPQLDEWITRALQAPETWLLTRHERHWQLINGHLTHHDER